MNIRKLIQAVRDAASGNMSPSKMVAGARKYIGPHMPGTAKGNARAAGLLGSLLRMTDRATGNGLMLRSSGSRRLEHLSDLIEGPAATILKDRNASKVLGAMDDATSGKAMRTLFKGTVLDHRMPHYAARKDQTLALPEALTKLRKATGVSDDITVDPTKLTPQQKHSIIAGYSKTLDRADHGTFASPANSAANEVTRAVEPMDKGKQPMNDLFKIKSGDRTIYATGQNLNGFVYVEEAAGHDARDTLAFLRETGKSDIPMGTTVMLDIGDMMARDSAHAAKTAKKLGKAAPPGWHVVALTEGRWGDPFQREIITPKLILVNDAAYKAGMAERAIMQHSALYNPKFIQRTKFYDKNIKAGMDKYKAAAMKYKSDYMDLMPDGAAMRDRAARRKAVAQQYYDLVQSGTRPDGTPATENDYLAALGRLRNEDSAVAYDMDRMSRMLNLSPESFDAKVTRQYWQNVSTPDPYGYGLAEPAGPMSPGAYRMMRFRRQDSPFTLDPDGAVTKKNEAGKLRLHARAPEERMTKTSAYANLSALWKTIRNASSLAARHPLRAAGEAVTRLGFDLPVQTALLMRHPKDLFSNASLYKRLAGEYHSHEQIADMIRHIRTNQIAGVSSLAAAGGGAYAALLGGSGKQARPSYAGVQKSRQQDKQQNRTQA